MKDEEEMIHIIAIVAMHAILSREGLNGPTVSIEAYDIAKSMVERGQFIDKMGKEKTISKSEVPF